VDWSWERAAISTLERVLKKAAGHTLKMNPWPPPPRHIWNRPEHKTRFPLFLPFSPFAADHQIFSPFFNLLSIFNKEQTTKEKGFAQV